MREPPALVAFDLDDTLYLEREYVRSGFEAAGWHARQRWGVSGLAQQAWSLFEQGVRGKVFDLALARLGAHASAPRLGELVQVYREHVPSLALLPDAVEALAVLRPRCHLAIITDGPPVSQRRKVEALGLRDLVRTIILTWEQGEEFSKPSPWAYREVETRVGVRGQACAYIGDNPVKDFVAAKGRGWRTVRVSRPGGLYAEVRAAVGDEPDCTVRDLREAIAWLDLLPPAGE